MKRRNVRDGRQVGGSNDVAASSSDDPETARTDDGATVDETTTTTTTRERLRRASPRLTCACVVAVLLYLFARVAWTSSTTTTTSRGDTTTTTKVVGAPQRRPPLFDDHANSEERSSSTTRNDHANAPSKKTTTKKKKSDADHDSDSNNRRVDDSNVVPPPPPRLVGEDAVSNLRPFLGAHRPDADAVFAFAEGYRLEVYVTFFESLRRTGFAGDVVLAVSSPAKLKPGVRDYLERRSRNDEGRPRLVAYSVAWSCLSKKGAPIDHVNSGFSDCTADGLYRRPTDEDGRGVPDPRPPRPVATARYELYWAWATRYGPRSRVALVDARDTFFQRHPFTGLPPRRGEDDAATLHLYLENHEATSITRSNYNRRWIEGAYGKDVVRSIANEPVVCSGSTIGDQSALETYLRLMVRQFDDTRCTMTGCDQGMHNYVRYVSLRRYDDERDKQQLVGGIGRVVVHEQGRGQINNLAAMRTKTLREWGVMGKDEDGEDVVLNWDGTVSPVVHQFDRDDELKRIIQRKTAAFVKEVRDGH